MHPVKQVIAQQRLAGMIERMEIPQAKVRQRPGFHPVGQGAQQRGRLGDGHAHRDLRARWQSRDRSGGGGQPGTEKL